MRFERFLESDCQANEVRDHLELRSGKTGCLALVDDIYKTSELICSGIYKNDQGFEYQEVVRGINQIRPLIISEIYNHYSAIVNASKAAYLSVLLKKGINEIQQYDPSLDLRPIKLSSPINPAINKIKTFRPEAFFYWMQIEKLLAE